MTDQMPPFYQVISEDTSFKRVIGPTGQEALEVTIESIIKSLAGVTEARTQEFSLTGDQASNLVGALQTITENMLNLVNKSTELAKQRYDEAAKPSSEETNEEANEEEEDNETALEEALPVATDE